MTLRFVLIGHPVGHSLSPAIHGRAYEILGADAAYSLADCPTEADVRAQVERIRVGDLAGANVTVPWKQLAFDLADERDRTATDVGVANVLARSPSGAIVAHNTDASALATELEATLRETGVDAMGSATALVLGNGGAAMAALSGCGIAGIGEVFATARRYTPDSSRDTWPRAGEVERLGARAVPWFGSEELSEVIARTHLVIQATSAGMKGAPGGEELAALIPWGMLKGRAAYDLVYVPRETPFLREAARHGLVARGGLGMLVGQAADAMRIWLGAAPAREPLLAAAEEALQR